MGFPLHSTLGDLIQVTTHSRYLEGDIALMQSVMARLTQGEEVGQRIFATMFPEDQMMSLQPHTSFTAVLAPIARAIVTTTVMVNMGLLRSVRNA